MNDQNFGEPMNISNIAPMEIIAVDSMHAINIDIEPKDETLMGRMISHETPIIMDLGSEAALLNADEAEQFRTRWNEIQGKFVDEPRSAVQQADKLVSAVIDKIIRMFANEHSSLEGQWQEGNQVSTEVLRKSLQRYRSFFNRLVLKNEE